MPEHETGEGEPPTPEESKEHEKEEAEDEQPLELPKALAALTGTTAGGEGATGMPQPQNTQATDEAAVSAMAQAEAETGGKALIAIEPPTVVDAKGHAVPSVLRLAGETVTLSISPTAEASYPLLGAVTVAAPTDTESQEKDPVHYGLADQNLADVQPLNSRLEEGPLEIKYVRKIVSWNIAKEKAAYEQLKLWLKAVKEDGPELEPMVTLGVIEHGVKPKSASEYRTRVKAAMNMFKSQIKSWGAWNEPDFSNNDALASGLAAELWEAAESANLETHCGCTVLAGEFTQYAEVPQNHVAYVKHYLSKLLSPTFCSKCWNKNRLEWRRHGHPRVWGLHDYYDIAHYLENHGNKAATAQAFLTLLASKFSKPEVWITEAGVELRTGANKKTALLEPNDEPLSVVRQTQAADEFLRLGNAAAPHERSHIGRVYYYSYREPSEQRVVEKEEHKPPEEEFDSGMVEEGAGTPSHGLSGFDGDPRPAYCVLNYATHICPPEIETTPPAGNSDAEAVAKVYGQAATVEFTVHPFGRATEHFTKLIGPQVYKPVPLGADEDGCPGEYSYTATVVTAAGERAQAAHEVTGNSAPHRGSRSNTCLDPRNFPLSR